MDAIELRTRILKLFKEIPGRPFPLSSKAGRLESSASGATSAASRHASYRGKISQYPHLRQLFKVIEENLGKFYYGDHSIDEWRRRYIFPSPLTAKAYASKLVKSAQGTASDAESLIANKNIEDVERWIDIHVVAGIREAPRQGPAISLLLGDVGCGKSTFTKFMLNVFRHKFIDQRIIPSRIECRKILSLLQKEHNFPRSNKEIATYLPVFNAYVIRNIFRDLIHFCYTVTPDGVHYAPCEIAVKPFPCIFGTEFEEFCARIPEGVARHFDSKFKIFEIIREKTLVYLRTPTKERPEALIQQFADEQSLATISIIVAFYAKSGVHFCLFFDGFDYIQLADFLFQSPQARILDLLGEWLKSGGDDACITFPMTPFRISPKVVISLRYSTLGEFNSRYSQAFGRHDRHYSHVAPPSFPDFYDAFFKNLNTHFVKRGDVRRLIEELRKIVRLVRQNIRDELKLGGAFTFGDLFNGNVRHQLNFTRDIILEIVYETLSFAPDGFDTKLPDLIALLDYELTNFIKQKRYRFVDLLLYSMNNRFTNFISILDLEKLELAAKKADRANIRFHEYVKDNNYDSGYVGNVFNYHIRYGRVNQLRFLLEKVRILELLSRAASDGLAGLTKEQIHSHFLKNGWGESPLFNVSLYILVREGLVYVDGAVIGGVFRATALGRIVVGRLVQRVIYMENVYFGTLLPAPIHDASDNIIRDPHSIKAWVTSSIFHLYLFLKLIRQAEREVTPSTQRSPRPFFFDRIFAPLLVSVEAIVDEDLHGAQKVEQTATFSAYSRIMRTMELEL